MNIIFFGSSHFAVPSLRALLNTHHQVSCVVTQPDRKKGRGLIFAPTEVKKIAGELGLGIYQPSKVNSSESAHFLRDLQPDLFVVIAYGQILSKEILDIPRIFSINVHASLLPKFRGAAPINWAIIKGEKTTGITIIKMTEVMDAGEIISMKEVDIQREDNTIILEDKLSHLAREVLLETIASIEQDNYNLIPQDENKQSLAPKLKKEDGRIDWNKPAEEIHNLIRGSLGWPCAFTYYKGKILKINKTEVCRFAGLPVCRLPGEIIKVSKEGIIVATADGNLIIEELQLEGKRSMTVKEFIAGHKISQGEILGKLIKK